MIASGIIFGGVAAAIGLIAFAVLKKKKKVPPVVILPPVDKPIDIPIPIQKEVWKDRRPIGMIMLAEYVEPWGPDDRKWKLGGTYQFSRDALMTHAEESIKHMQEVGAQGMITWNIEGEQWWKPISYIGDPRFLAPEIEPYIDEYFDRFKSAGFAVGVCLRPDKYVPLKDNVHAHHMTVASPFDDLVTKTEYAKKRWGCTLFYIDSNKDMPAGIDNTIGAGNPLPASVFAELAKLFPDCLFIPEHHRPDYYPHVAIWTKGPYVVPCALVVSEVAGDMEVKEFIKAGNIPLFEAWWETPILNRIKNAYADK